MDLDHTLLSPLWWASVLVCTIALTAACRWLARRLATQTARPRDTPSTTRLRLGSRVIGLLVLANLTMLGGLAAANLPTPRLAGPIGLAFVLCCLVSLVLAVLTHTATMSDDD